MTKTFLFAVRGGRDLVTNLDRLVGDYHSAMRDPRASRRKQFHFRKDPTAYLAALGEILLKTSLPS